MIASAILETLTYSDHFGFPLKIHEIATRLIRHKSPGITKLKHELDLLISKKLVEQYDSYYCLYGHSNLIKQRKTRHLFSSNQLQTTHLIAQKLSQIPNVLAIYLTGSLAMSNSQPDSDIDLMIITKNNRLWTTRLLLTIYTELLGVRRRPSTQKPANKLCLNLYLSPSSFTLPKSKRSLYTAYELIQAVPIYDPHKTQAALLSANSWIKKYLPNFPLPQFSYPQSLEYENTKILEYVLYHLQLFYMRRKITREYIKQDAAFFHPNNPGKVVLKKLGE